MFKVGDKIIWTHLTTPSGMFKHGEIFTITNISKDGFMCLNDRINTTIDRHFKLAQPYLQQEEAKKLLGLKE